MPGLHVSEELGVDRSCFKVSGGLAGKKFSWQLATEPPLEDTSIADSKAKLN